MKNLLLFGFFFLAIVGFSQEKLRVGIIKYKTKEKVNATFPPLMKYVAEKLGKDALVQIVPEDELAFHLNNGAFDIGIFTVFPYLKAKSDFPDGHLKMETRLIKQKDTIGHALDEDQSEVKDIIQDGKVTEGDFSRIMGILNKRK